MNHEVTDSTANAARLVLPAMLAVRIAVDQTRSRCSGQVAGGKQLLITLSRDSSCKMRGEEGSLSLLRFRVKTERTIVEGKDGAESRNT